jgi:hypothetical protein
MQTGLADALAAASDLNASPPRSPSASLSSCSLQTPCHPTPHSPKAISQSFQCSPLLKTLPKTSPLHGISKKRLQQRSLQPVGASSLARDSGQGLVLPKRVYQLQDDSFEQVAPTRALPARATHICASSNRLSVLRRLWPCFKRA